MEPLKLVKSKLNDLAESSPPPDRGPAGRFRLGKFPVPEEDRLKLSELRERLEFLGSKILKVKASSDLSTAEFIFSIGFFTRVDLIL